MSKKYTMLLLLLIAFATMVIGILIYRAYTTDVYFAANNEIEIQE